MLVTCNVPTCLTLVTCKSYRHIGGVEIELHSFFRLAVLLSGKEPPVPIKWEAGWAPEDVQKNIFCLTRESNQDSLI
jgi:hypothetical protein